MFQIKNNIVYLTRGEDAVYARAIRRRDKYNSPFIISNGLKNPKIRFTIKANKNDKNYILKYEGFIGKDIPTFDSQAIIDITEYPADIAEIKRQVYRMTLVDSTTKKKTYTYHYYDGELGENVGYNYGNWKNYELIIRIPFQSDDTKNLTPATYYYDIALITRDNDNNIEFSNTLLTPTEFIIGGSYGE